MFLRRGTSWTGCCSGIGSQGRNGNRPGDVLIGVDFGVAENVLERGIVEPCGEMLEVGWKRYRFDQCEFRRELALCTVRAEGADVASVCRSSQ